MEMLDNGDTIPLSLSFQMLRRLTQMRYCLLVSLVSCLMSLLAACASPLATEPGPPATPTALLAPYNNAIATAEARGDPREQAIAFYERGNVHLDSGDYKAAIDDYDHAVTLNVQNARAFNNRGLAHEALGQRNEALSDYSSAITLDSQYTHAYQNRLHLEEKVGDLRNVAADYAQLAQIDPANRADHLYGQGSALLELRDNAGAHRAFDAAIAANPQQVDVLYERALLNYADDNLTAAIADLNAALQLSPKATNAHYARGLAFSASGDNQRALADFDATLSAQPDNADALLGRAVAYAALGDAAHARADLDRLNQLNPDDAIKTGAEALWRQVGQ